jgi:hypothetical protein
MIFLRVLLWTQSLGKLFVFVCPYHYDGIEGCRSIWSRKLSESGPSNTEGLVSNSNSDGRKDNHYVSSRLIQYSAYLNTHTIVGTK